MRRFRRSTCPRSPRWRREKPALSRRPRPSCLAVGVDCPRANCSPALRIKTRVPDAARVLPDLATGVSREEVLSATLRAWGRRAPSGIAREAGTAVRTGFAGHREHLRRRVHWSFTLGKQLTNHSPARRGSIFSSAAQPRRSSSLSNRHGTHQTRRGPARPSTHASGSSTRAARSDARSSRRFTSRGRSRARRGFQNSKERKVGIRPRRA